MAMASPVPLSDHIVYVKDEAGNIIRTGETVYNGRIMQHPPEFSQLAKIFSQMQDFPLRKDDIWLLDYCKSGTHWMVSILQLLTQSELAPVIQAKKDSMLEVSLDLATCEQMTSPRILSTHMRLDLIPKRLLEQNKIIMMIRNPKSVIVSMFHHIKNTPFFYDYAGTFHDFFPGFVKGLYPEFYGSWFDYVIEFYKAFKGKPNMLFVFYEELKQDPKKVIKNVSDFLDYNHDLSFIEDVVKQTSIDGLREKEKEMLKDTPFGVLVNTMFRKGSVTDWKNYFTVAENEMFDALYEEKMTDLPDLKARIRFS